MTCLLPEVMHVQSLEHSDPDFVRQHHPGEGTRTPSLEGVFDSQTCRGQRPAWPVLQFR